VRIGYFTLLVVLLTACAALPAAEDKPVSQPEDVPSPTARPTETISQPPAEATSLPLTETALPLPTEAPFRASLEDLGAAPELENEVWLNTEAPLRLAELHGKVVLLDMWTFG